MTKSAILHRIRLLSLYVFTMSKIQRKNQKSDQLVGFFCTPDEKQMIKIALRIYNMQTKENKSMSDYIRSIVIPNVKMEILVFEDNNLKEPKKPM